MAEIELFPPGLPTIKIMLLFWIIIFCILGSVGSIALAGVFLLLKEGQRQSLVPLLVSYATGTLLGASFLALLPHILEEIAPLTAFITVLATIIAFFGMEKSIILRHCHDNHCDRHTAAGTLILIGDAFHNFVDGIAIAAGFLTSIPVGISTALAAISHEVPQEVGDFAILLESGFDRLRAFGYNALSGLSALPGALAGYFLLAQLDILVPYLLAIAAAGFIYIAMADLVPHLHEKSGLRNNLLQFILILAGVATIVLLEWLTGDI
ncbi:MAG TPA: ZIP family metal transporter [Armatimonadota bacterium]|nr:ZIP family metal transporter [Armatimonadota bacterium]